MGKWVGWVLSMVMASGAVAHAGGPKHADTLARWDAVRDLRPGEEIDVLAEDGAGTEACMVSSVDEVALTCRREDLSRDTRLVFPRGAVREVWVWEASPNRHIVAWIAAAVLAGLAIAACVEAGPAGLLVVALIGIPMAAALDSDAWPGMGPAPPIRRLPRMRWRLLYRGVTP